MTAGRTINSKSKDWCTPKKYVDAVRELFSGEIHLDPCSNKHSIVNAKVEYFLPNNNGLSESWNFPTIYVNPPYGRDKESSTSIRDWLERCAEANEKHGSEVIALVPVATNTAHWKKSVYKKAKGLCFLFDTRLKFLENGMDGGKGAPMSCVIIYWGNNYDKFYDVFIKHGAIIDLSPLKNEERMGNTL